MANQRRPSERDLVHIRVLDNVFAACRPKARENVHNAWREPSLLDQLADLFRMVRSNDVYSGISTPAYHERREGRLLRALQHHRAAGRKSWTKLPGEHEQREVPRDDLANNADGLVTRVAQKRSCVSS